MFNYRRKKYHWYFGLVGMVLFVVDQLIKFFIKNNPERVWDYFLFQVQLAQNRGMAFSLPFSRLIIITATFFIISFLMIYFLKNQPAKQWPIFFFYLIIWGALSNLVDRLFLGSVIDYIDWKFYFINIVMHGSVSWPVFNLADMMIIAGAGGWAVFILRSKN